MAAGGSVTGGGVVRGSVAGVGGLEVGAAVSGVCVVGIASSTPAMAKQRVPRFSKSAHEVPSTGLTGLHAPSELRSASLALALVYPAFSLPYRL